MSYNYKIIINMHEHCKANVKWNGVISDNFNVPNGVKQGGVLSPFLFNLYLDPFLKSLRKSNVGCFVDNYCANSFAYADNIALLSPTITRFKKLINICKEYSVEFKISFNLSKCSLLCFPYSLNYNFNSLNINIYIWHKNFSL